MDLFTYLMAKNNHNTSVHGDLFSYLLAKNGGTVKTITGTVINITDAKNRIINRLEMSKVSSQETTTGKNKLEISTTTSQGITGTKNKDGSITLSGTTAQNWFNVTTVVTKSISAGTYTFSINEALPHNLFLQFTTVNNETISCIIIQGQTSRTVELTDNVKSYYIFTDQWTVGETINITLYLQLEEGLSATSYEPYTGGQASPNPDYPQEIKTVEGYRNLFDKDNANIQEGYIHATDKKIYSANNRKYLYISCTENTNYTVLKGKGTYFRVGSTSSTPALNSSLINAVNNDSGSIITINTGPGANYLVVSYYYSVTDTLTEQEILDSIMITEGTEEKPYVPYGTNWIYTEITNGTDTNYFTIPLNGNELAGIGNYKDELIVDSDGHCWLNKLTGKDVLDGSETYLFSTNGNVFYISNWSTDNNSIYPSDNTITIDLYSNNFLKNSRNMLAYIDYGMAISYNGALNIKHKDYNSSSQTNNFKTWLSAHNTEVVYPLATPQLIDLNYDVDIRLFKGVNNISNSDDMDMILKYY